MDWFRVDSGLPQHHKLGRLARTLRAPRAHVGWSLLCLWAWAARNREDGNLAGMDADEIAEVSAWEGESEPWLAALAKCKLIDENPGGARSIHGWQERQPLLKRREWNSNRERKTNTMRARSEHAASTQRAPCVEPQTYRQTDRQEKPPLSPNGSPDALTADAVQIKLTRTKARYRFRQIEEELDRLRQRNLVGVGPTDLALHEAHVQALLDEGETVRVLAFPE